MTTPRAITFQPDIYGKVLSLLPAPAGTRILDVGAGEGFFTRVLAERGYSVEACDFDPSAFRVDGISCRAADLTDRLPFPDGAFDCAVSIEVVEHVLNHARFFAEIFRVVRPGGTVVVTTPNVLSLSSRLHFFVYGYSDAAPIPIDPARPDWYRQHVNPISLPEILFHVERSGGELVRLETNRWRRGALPLMLLYPILALAVRRKLLRRRHAAAEALHRRHLRWMLSPANLLGRITIAVCRRSG